MKIVFKLSIGKSLLCLILILLKFNYSSATSTLDCVTATINNVVTGSDVCLNSNGTITIASSQAGVIYNAYSIGAPSIVGTGNGNGGDLIISIGATQLTEGSNAFDIIAVGCDAVTLTTKAIINVLGNIGSISGPTSVCSSANSGLNYSISPVTGVYFYNWTINNGGVITSNGYSAVADLSSTVSTSTIVVQVVTSNGMTCSSQSLQVNQILDYLAESLSISEDTVCTGSTVQFTVKNPNAMSYNWVLGAGVEDKSPSSNTSKTFLFNNAGVSTVEFKPVHPCRSSISSLIIQIQVIATPIANAGSDIQQATMQTAMLDGSASSTGPYYRYNWTTSDPSSIIATPNAITTNIIPNAAQSFYTLTVSTVNSASCFASDEVKVTIGTTATAPSIDENNKITLYPMPANNSLMIKGIEENISVDVLDFSGNKVMHAENKQINVSSLSSGPYFILIHSNDKVYSKVFIKE